jgi:hypothetical protein
MDRVRVLNRYRFTEFLGQAGTERLVAIGECNTAGLAKSGPVGHPLHLHVAAREGAVTGGGFWPDPADACPAVPGKARQAVGIGMLMAIVVIGFGGSGCCIAA